MQRSKSHYETLEKDPSRMSLRYDIKQSVGKTPVMLELWVMWSTSSLPSLPDPLWPEVVAIYKVLSLG